MATKRTASPPRQDLQTLLPASASQLEPLTFYRQLYERALAHARANMQQPSTATAKAASPPHPSATLPSESPQQMEWDRLVDELSRRRVALISQYQTLPECREFTARLLRRLLDAQPQRPIACALDNFEAAQQPMLDAFASGRLSEAELLQGTAAMARLGLRHWQSLQGILHLAAPAPQSSAVSGRVRLLAADAPSEVTELRSRDLMTLRTVRDWLKENPHGLCLVLLGDQRVSEGYIWEELRGFLDKSADKVFERRPLVLLQAWEDAAWRLMQHAEFENLPPARLQELCLRWGPSSDLFSVNHIPPLVKLDSFITWSHEQEAWPGWPPDAVLSHMSQLIRKTLNLPEASASSTYCCGDLSLLKRIKNADGISDDQGMTLLKQMLNFESYYLPGPDIIYLATLDGYHIGEEIGHSLRIRLTGEKPQEMSLSPSGWLFYSAVNEAAGYLASKIIAPGRRTGRRSLRLCRELGSKPSQAALDRALRKADARRIDLFGHEAGYGLGEMLFRALQGGKRRSKAADNPLASYELSPQQLQALFTRRLCSEQEARQLFEELYSAVSRVSTSSGRLAASVGGTLHERLHWVGLFYFFLFFLPALLWGRAHDLLRFPQPILLNWQRDLALAGAAAGLVVGLTYLLGRWVRPFRELSTRLRDFIGPLNVQEMFLIAALSALGEEFMFRGVVQAEFGIVLASLLFAIMHFVPDRRFVLWPVFAFITGLMLGMLYKITGNLWVPVLAHFLINWWNLLLERRRTV